MRRVSDHEVRDFKKPLGSYIARRSVACEHWVQINEGCRYEALELFQVENDDAIRRDLGSDLQVRSGREVVLARAFGRRQSFFKQVAHSFEGRVQSSCVKKGKAFKLHCGQDLRIDKACEGENSRGTLSRGAYKRRGASMHRGTFVQEDFGGFRPRALTSCRCRMLPGGEGIRVLAVGHGALSCSVEGRLHSRSNGRRQQSRSRLWKYRAGGVRSAHRR